MIMRKNFELLNPDLDRSDWVCLLRSVDASIRDYEFSLENFQVPFPSVYYREIEHLKDIRSIIKSTLGDD